MYIAVTPSGARPEPVILDYRIPEHRPLIYRLLALTPPTPAIH